MKTLVLNGIELKYKVEGDRGPVVVLLHGFGGGPQDWSEVLPILTRNYRVVVPNLKIFFANAKPLTFSEQVLVLSGLISSLLQRKNVSQLSLMGQSYGATLAMGACSSLNYTCQKLVLLNPMPFHPLRQVRDPHLKVLIDFSYAPSAVGLFLKSDAGKKSLHEAAKIFRIGSDGRHEVHHFNDRKMALVEKAVERFRWIDQNEKWSDWERQVKNKKDRPEVSVLYSSHDHLFSAADYESFATQLGADVTKVIDHVGHLLIQDRGSDVINVWPFLK